MSARKLVALVPLIVSASLLGACASSTVKQEVVATPVAPTLDRLAKLEGDWYRIGPDGKATDELVSRFDVSAAGTAVVETMFPGQDSEMVTVYHHDGPQLILQHYCSHGNQPRMAATAASTSDRFVFDFVSGTNMQPEDPHVHAITLTIESADVLRVDVVGWSGGTVAERGNWRLQRKRS